MTGGLLLIDSVAWVMVPLCSSLRSTVQLMGDTLTATGLVKTVQADPL
jgi:hypothetical protein